MCQCGFPKVERVVSSIDMQWIFIFYYKRILKINNIQVGKPGPNLGRKFFACPKPSHSQCQVLYIRGIVRS